MGVGVAALVVCGLLLLDEIEGAAGLGPPLEVEHPRIGDSGGHCRSRKGYSVTLGVELAVAIEVGNGGSARTRGERTQGAHQYNGSNHEENNSKKRAPHPRCFHSS
jgi:hypothetical protein